MTALPTTRTTTAPPAAAVAPARRAGVATWAAAVLLLLLVGAHVAGGVMFGFVWTDDPVGPGLVFLATVVVVGLTALAAVPGLLRGDRTAWAVAAAWAFAYEYWTVYKVFGELEWISLPHLVAGAALLALLALPSVRPISRVAAEVR